MTRRGTLVLAILAVLGVGVAFGIGLAANAISGDRIGLSARPLNAGDELAPAQAREPGEEERVFERFFRGSSKAQRPRGSGLGLTIVRVLARRWGGDATIANRPEGGARAVVRLPLAPAAPAPDPEPVTTVMEDR